MTAPARPVKPCTCPRARHEHGHPGRYRTDGCRCDPCTDAVARYNARLELGHRVRRPATRARAHVTHLNRAGMSFAVMAAQSRLTELTLRRIATGHTRTVFPTTEARILALRPALHPGHRVPTTGATRRLQALAYNGWTSGELATRVGVSRSHIIALTAGDLTVTRADTVLAVRRVFEALWDKTPPPGSRGENSGHAKTRAHARRRKWVPALAWDDIDHDPRPVRRSEWVRDDRDRSNRNHPRLEVAA